MSIYKLICMNLTCMGMAANSHNFFAWLYIHKGRFRFSLRNLDPYSVIQEKGRLFWYAYQSILHDAWSEAWANAAREQTTNKNTRNPFIFASTVKTLQGQTRPCLVTLTWHVPRYWAWWEGNIRVETGSYTCVIHSSFSRWRTALEETSRQNKLSLY